MATMSVQYRHGYLLATIKQPWLPLCHNCMITSTSSHNHQVMATMSVQYKHGYLLATIIQSWLPLCHNCMITSTSSHNHQIMATMSVQYKHGHLLATIIRSCMITSISSHNHATSLSQLYDHVHFFSQPSDNGHYGHYLMVHVTSGHHTVVLSGKHGHDHVPHQIGHYVMVHVTSSGH